VRRTRPLIRLIAPVLATGLVLTACGGSEEETPEDSPQAAAPEAPATWPLTGEDAGDESVDRQVYIAKIDNTAESDPQYGLGNADFVTEELVEGGITRLAVFYQSDTPGKVGPIRSMRATDVGIASPVGAQIITSGAAAYTFGALKKAGVKWIDMNNPNVVRTEDGSHDTLHSVVANVKKIAASAKEKAKRPADYFPWGEESDFPGTKKVASFSANFGGARTSTWKYDGGEYVLQEGGGHSGNYMAEGDEFTPKTVIAAQVKTSVAPYKDPAGNDVPVSHFEGKGKAWIFHGGTLVKATWQKKTESSPVTFEFKGKELTIPAGKVWLELVPKNGGSVKLAK